MGLMIHSLGEVPSTIHRGYYVYLLDYGWDEPLGEAIERNFDRMAALASCHDAVVVRGVVGSHFADEVLSWHHVNGQPSNELLPAILITTRNPHEFREGRLLDRTAQPTSERMLIIPLRRSCKSTSDVIEPIDKLFADIRERKELMNFRVAQDMQQGSRGAFVDARVLEPSTAGAGIRLDEIAAFLKRGLHHAEITGKEAGMIKVLLLSANPIDDPLGIDGEFRAIDSKLRGSDHRDHVQLINHGAVRLEDVPGLLMRHKPHVVHFSGHGDASGIALTEKDGLSKSVPSNALATIFKALKDNVRVVLLNACDSAPQAEAIVSVIDCAVGMADEIGDDAAVAFAAAFYEALGYGKSVQTAFELARVQLTGAGEDPSLAKLYKRRGVKPSNIMLVNPAHP